MSRRKSNYHLELSTLQRSSSTALINPSSSKTISNQDNSRKILKSIKSQWWKIKDLFQPDIGLSQATYKFQRRNLLNPAKTTSTLKSFRLWKLTTRGRVLSLKTSIWYSFSNFRSSTSNSNRLWLREVWSPPTTQSWWSKTEAQGCILPEANRSCRCHLKMGSILLMIFSKTTCKVSSKSAKKIHSLRYSKGSHLGMNFNKNYLIALRRLIRSSIRKIR